MTALQALEKLRTLITSEQNKPAYDITQRNGIEFSFKMGVITANGKTIAEIDKLIVEVIQGGAK
ncbi:MAG: hypothetical protein FWE01_00795 [Firmicutes bacterium]|nr:hypothetical protein [Bacillota bacterium]